MTPLKTYFTAKPGLRQGILSKRGVHGQICDAFLDSGSPPAQKFLKEQTVLTKDKEFWSLQRVLHR